MKKSVLLAVVLLVTACETAPVRREDYIAKHPQWDPKTVQLIRAGMIAKGMTKEQVRAAWGRPCYLCQGTTKGDWGSSWEFDTQVVFFGPDGRVLRWEPK